ncbi:hypothetical protein Nepgr_026603 [Nepenthes gracilis]|uniref:Uncharacterized protein n=1 Tax=Nepenthes gracilis TaxID=150966 RepID=A0AAD3T845_NEPGR|nr:hypothetical protein Nepgr_026603 [Nepenthes gracilis]
MKSIPVTYPKKEVYPSEAYKGVASSVPAVFSKLQRKQSLEVAWTCILMNYTPGLTRSSPSLSSDLRDLLLNSRNLDEVVLLIQFIRALMLPS